MIFKKKYVIITIGDRMKKIIKLLILIIMIVPVYINAKIVIYSEAVANANQYITNFKNYHDYINYENMPYVYANKSNQYSDLFKSGGLLSKDEFLITNYNGKSYLGSSIEYWTLTQHSTDNNYVIDYTLKNKKINCSKNDENCGISDVRPTEFVKNEVKIKGSGTRSNPWEFINVKSVNLYSSNKDIGKLSTSECNDISQGNENISVTIYEGIDAIFYACTNQFYRYKTTTCFDYIKPIVNSNKYNIDNEIGDNTICRIDFGYQTYNIELESCSSCTNDASPKLIYLAKNKDNFFLDTFGEGKFTKLSTIPNKTGYKFEGYYYDGTQVIKEDGTIIDSSKNVISGNVIISPKFTANTYNITYEYNGGTVGSSAPTTATYDQTIVISNPTKLGYTFAGWQVTSGLDSSTAKYGSTDNPTTNITSSSVKIKSQYFKNITSTDGATVTLSATWTANTHSIKYEYNGGSKGTSSPTTGTYDSVLTINNPTKTGYTFNGWTITSGLNTSTAKHGTTNNPTTAITSTTTLIKSEYFKNLTPVSGSEVKFNANWTANKYAVTLDQNGATTSGTTSVEATFDSTLPKITIPQKKYTVTYNANGGSVSPTTATSTVTFEGYNYVDGSTKIKYYDAEGTGAKAWNIASNTTLTAAWSATPTVTLPTPSRTGYTFTGWYENSSGTGTKYNASSNYTPTSSKTLYASWTLNSYTITYYLNGGTNPSGTKESYNAETADYTLPTPSKNGYTFAGWYTESSFSNKVTQIAKGSTGNKTFYAKWTANSYTITYVLNDGTNATGAKTSYTVETADYTLPTPSKNGYTFAGWYTESSFSNKVTNIPKGSTGNKTFYAKWTANNYTVTISRNNTSYGSVSNSSVSIPYGTTYTTSGGTLTFSNGTTITASVINATGYNTTVSSWSSSSGTITGATTITVNFARSPKTFTVTFNANGGSVSPTTQTVTYNSTYGSLPTPTKTNCNFLGWYTATTGGTKITSTTAVTTTSNQTLYAQWEQLHTLPIFTYTGKYELVKDDDTVIASGTNTKVTIPTSYEAYTGNWKIRFLTSGTITFHELRGASNGIDVFLVGGGGNGGGTFYQQAGRHGYSSAGGGGGGGYNTLQNGVSVSLTSYELTIGASASQTKGFGYTANGGGQGENPKKSDYDISGGAGTATGGLGGYNAASGTNGGDGVCEFRNCSLYSKKYGGGGGGGHAHNGKNTADKGYPTGIANPGAGGAGGGGTGNNQFRGGNTHNGAANTGGGGGGGSFVFDVYDACGTKSDSSCKCWSSDGCFGVSKTTAYAAGKGGSGIIIIRNKR